MEMKPPRYVDRGEYWEDMEAEPKIEYDKDGFMTSYIFTPYIPKAVVSNDPNKDERG